MTEIEDEINEKGEEVDDLNEIVEQAQEFHNIIDNMKEVSNEMVMRLLINRGDTDDEEEIEKIDEAIPLVRSVAQRIEEGDSARSRRP